jgi:hypothetical protein
MEHPILRFPRMVQLRHIAAELMRARNAERSARPDRVKGSLKRAFDLIDILLTDPKWKDHFHSILLLREEIAKAYIGAQSVAMVLKVL